MAALGTAAMFEDIDSELMHRIDSLIKELEDRITRAIKSDDRLTETVGVLRSIPGIGPVASAMLIAIANALCKSRQKWIATTT